MKTLISILFVVIAAPLFADDYERNVKTWEKFLSKNRWGNSQDFWLEKNTSMGWEKVILVMGYFDDWQGCKDIKIALNNAYPIAEYRCIPAN